MGHDCATPVAKSIEEDILTASNHFDSDGDGATGQLRKEEEHTENSSNVLRSRADLAAAPPMTLSLLRRLWPEWNSDPANASGTDTYHPIYNVWRDASCSESHLEEPLLYLGGNAIPEATLTSCNVTHILSLVSSKRCQKPAAADADVFKRLIINIEDDYDADLRASFSAAFRFLDEMKKDGGTCYVHCEQGRSRSAAMVIGWLMHRRARLGQRPSLLECYSAVASRRRISALNYGFFARLCDLEGKLALEAYGSYIGTPSLSLLQYFMLHLNDSKLFIYPPPPSLDELRKENGLEENDGYATSRQKSIRRLLRGFCYVLKSIGSSSRACQHALTELRTS